MNSSEKIFMLVVEEMSFTKAAKKTFLTQQCISEHIKKLEREYGVSFFERRPKLVLTPAGKSMYQAMLQIQNMKNSLELNLKEIARGAMGEIKIGSNASRARVIMPILFKKYHEKYPRVTISVFSDDTSVMTEMLINGKLDIVIGVDVASNPLFKITPLADDPVYVIVSNNLLKQSFGEKYTEYKKIFPYGVNLSLFEKIPFVRNYPTSTINSLIDRHINRYNINLQTVFSISDYGTQLQLCASHQVAAFIPALICRTVLKFNDRAGEDDHINIFPIKNLNESLRIDCITLKNSYMPQYIQDFIYFIENEIKSETEWLKQNI